MSLPKETLRMTRYFRFRPGIIAAALVIACVCAFSARGQQGSEPLLVMISVDGMRPDYITEADARGTKVPNLRRFMREGAFAEGVQGVIPTVTYPSHTTLITGVWPAKHGIYANLLFDPLEKGKQAWYWYAEDLKVPTLYDAAREAGRKTASVQWPVTVGAKITWDIPEVWRASDENDLKLVHATATPGLMEEVRKDLGEYR